MLRTFVPDLQSWLGAADAVVCMGGYNTVSEVLVRGTPAVCVPRTVPRSEQLIRARALGSLGLLQVVEPERLNGATLRREVDVALTRSRPALARAARKALSFDGAGTSADLLLEEAARSDVRQAA
jgi:predicted glycosyltransferase